MEYPIFTECFFFILPNMHTNFWDQNSVYLIGLNRGWPMKQSNNFSKTILEQQTFICGAMISCHRLGGRRYVENNVLGGSNSNH